MGAFWAKIGTLGNADFTIMLDYDKSVVESYI